MPLTAASLPPYYLLEEKKKAGDKWEHMAQKEKEAAKETDPLLSTAASKV